MRTKIVTLLGLFLLLTIAGDAQNEWKLSKDKQGIKVWTRQPEGSKFKAFKAIITLNCSEPEVVYDVVKDVERQVEWVKDLSYAKVLSKGEGWKIQYNQIDLPWPVDDRDICLKSVTDKTNKDKITITSTSLPDASPKKEGYTRIKVIEGSWTFKRVGERQVEVIYQFLSDPAGNIPAWVVNMFIVDGPYETLENLKGIVEG